MTHENERQAFLRGAEAMREKCALVFEDDAKYQRIKTVEIPLTSMRIELLCEARQLQRQAEGIRALPLPEYREGNKQP